MSLNCFFTFKTFCKALDVASNATKIAQINKGMSKICLPQMKGVMGMWVSTYDQFAFWSLKSLDITLLSFHFKNILYNSKWHFHSFLNCSKQTRNEENMKFESKGGLIVFFFLEQAQPFFASLFLEFQEIL
jgi:ligand-binding SRPBCC domain-containing protein